MDDEVEKKLIKCLHELKDNYKLTDIEEVIIEDMELTILSERVRKELESFIHMESLQINRCSLKALDNLPAIDSIKRICLDHNQLSGKELSKLSIYPNLISVSIMDNKFENFEDVKQLALCPHLCQLNAYKNPVNDLPKFRQEMFDSLSGLILLDNLSKTGDEIGFNEEV